MIELGDLRMSVKHQDSGGGCDLLAALEVFYGIIAAFGNEAESHALEKCTILEP
jgi:hypothetical protein